MARPKANTEAGRIATERWRETMLKKYGSEEALRKNFREIGRVGGANGHTGGFASNPELARIAGKKGGKISRRSGEKAIDEKISENTDKINTMLGQGVSVRNIAKEIGISELTLRRRITINTTTERYLNV